MKLVSVVLAVLILYGFIESQQCDSICQASRATSSFLGKNQSSQQVIDFLNEYKGEALGAAIYGEFVNWGIRNSNKFVEITNHPNTTKRNLELIAYAIADYGNHAKWCEIYSDLTVKENDQYIRSRLLGCNYKL
ncbi:hypothetical protein [Pseudoalteromonas rubra]|uniref:Uncharacterized protein n=1 Tax=Pseudoalteromonas rubra TaxID=43658 RepID=A0A5S3WQB9_9GAMM|nr:hypothetical protein [Pseudoalteromonas rubra]TMP29773.1 hypothetical protein CWB98_23455 [Pseudoalteromonas rubra]